MRTGITALRVGSSLKLSLCALALLAASRTVFVGGEVPPPAKSAPVAVAAGTNATAQSPWDRIVMIGASASAGFTAFEPFGGTNTQLLRLSRYLEAALAMPHEPVRNLATALFFTQPEAIGAQQIEQALKAQPTVVVAADFLFWFCYGDGPTDEDRLRRFETGLKMLEPVKCPLLLGDLPNASAAVGIMLRKDQVPGARALVAANRRLKAWADSRPHVVVVSLSNFMHQAMANQPLTIHKQTLPEGSTRALLQFDKLHPSQSGCAALALAIVEALQTEKPKQFAGAVRWDPAEVLQLAVSPRPVLLSPPTKVPRAAVPADSK